MLAQLQLPAPALSVGTSVNSGPSSNMVMPVPIFKKGIPSVNLATLKDFLRYNVTISERMIDGVEWSTVVSVYTFESGPSSKSLEIPAVFTSKRIDVSCIRYRFLSVDSINESYQ